MSDIYLQIAETPTVVTLSAPVISGALSSTVTVANTVTVALDANSLSALENVTVGAAVTISNFPATQTVAGTVTIGNSVTISTLLESPSYQQINAGISSYVGDYATFPISGTVTANLSDESTVDINGSATNVYSKRGLVVAAGNDVDTAVPLKTDGYRNLNVKVNAGSVTIGSLPAISGTVTVGNSVTIGSCVTHGVTIANTSVTVNGTFYQATQPVSLASVPTHGVTLASTTVTVSSLPALADGTNQIGSVTASISGTVPVSISSVTVGNSVTIGSIPAISGTVTANSSNGSLTTRFGSVTTANTAFATSAVTNANRKYLLIQNVTTASNVITVGIGFTPTTTQGIQLTAGAGLTFEGSYIPTGAVNLLSSVTASCFTILEA